jgi:enterobacteria phage integrase
MRRPIVGMGYEPMTRIKLRYVNEFIDRHGKVRYYFRRPGSRSVPLPGLPGSIEFMAAYQAALAGISPPPPSPKHIIRGSLAEIAAGYFRSASFANLSQSSQRLYRITLKPVLEAHGYRLVRDLPKTAARNLIEAIGATRPGRANTTRAALSQVIAYAMATGVRTDNPFSGLERYRLGTHHTWTDAEIAQFERRWRLGTRERLAFALLLYTGQRGGDVVKMVRSDIVDGRIRVSQDKVRKGTTNELMIPIHPALARALQAGPVVGMQHIITDTRGRPLKGLTALIERAVKLAGLPAHCVAHGLRKAALRRLAEHGSTTKEIAAMSGHRSLPEIERYTARADQARLAQSAVAKLSDEEND